MNMNKFIIFLVLIFVGVLGNFSNLSPTNKFGKILSSAIVQSNVVVADETADAAKREAEVAAAAASLKKLKTDAYDGLNRLDWLITAGDTQPVSSTTQVNRFIGKIISFLIMAVGSILLLLYVYAGILWMTASGNAENITKAKHILTWSTLSIVVIFSSYFLVQLLFGFLK